MVKTNIKELEITETMYKRAVEVENAWNELRKADKDNNTSLKDIQLLEMKWIRLDSKFQDEENDEFTTREIVLEYERRKRG